MMQAKTFRDLEVWKLAHQFVLSVYKLTEGLPKHELFGLTSQLRRAAVSVPANIADTIQLQDEIDRVARVLDAYLKAMLEGFAKPR